MKKPEVLQKLQEATEIVEADLEQDGQSFRMALKTINDAQDSLIEAKGSLMRTMASLEKLDTYLLTFDKKHIENIEFLRDNSATTLESLSKLVSRLSSAYQELLNLGNLPEG